MSDSDTSDPCYHLRDCTWWCGPITESTQRRAMRATGTYIKAIEIELSNGKTRTLTFPSPGPDLLVFSAPAFATYLWQGVAGKHGPEKAGEIHAALVRKETAGRAVRKKAPMRRARRK